MDLVGQAIVAGDVAGVVTLQYGDQIDACYHLAIIARLVACHRDNLLGIGDAQRRDIKNQCLVLSLFPTRDIYPKPLGFRSRLNLIMRIQSGCLEAMVKRIRKSQAPSTQAAIITICERAPYLFHFGRAMVYVLLTYGDSF